MGRHSEMELHSGINSLEYTSMIHENDDRGLYPFSQQNTYLRTDWVIVVRWHACTMYPYSLLCRLVNVFLRTLCQPLMAHGLQRPSILDSLDRCTSLDWYSDAETENDTSYQVTTEFTS